MTDLSCFKVTVECRLLTHPMHTARRKLVIQNSVYTLADLASCPVFIFIMMNMTMGQLADSAAPHKNSVNGACRKSVGLNCHK